MRFFHALDAHRVHLRLYKVIDVLDQWLEDTF